MSNPHQRGLVEIGSATVYYDVHGNCQLDVEYIFVRSSFVRKIYAFGFGVWWGKKMFYIAIILLRLFNLFCHHIMYDVECGYSLVATDYYALKHPTYNNNHMRCVWISKLKCLTTEANFKTIRISWRMIALLLNGMETSSRRRYHFQKISKRM